MQSLLWGSDKSQTDQIMTMWFVMAPLFFLDVFAWTCLGSLNKPNDDHENHESLNSYIILQVFLHRFQVLSIFHPHPPPPKNPSTRIVLSHSHVRPIEGFHFQAKGDVTLDRGLRRWRGSYTLVHSDCCFVQSHHAEGASPLLSFSMDSLHVKQSSI